MSRLPKDRLESPRSRSATFRMKLNLSEKVFKKRFLLVMSMFSPGGPKIGRPCRARHRSGRRASAKIDETLLSRRVLGERDALPIGDEVVECHGALARASWSRSPCVEIPPAATERSVAPPIQHLRFCRRSETPRSMCRIRLTGGASVFSTLPAIGGREDGADGARGRASRRRGTTDGMRAT
jgi:hypothetical protein